MSTNTRRKRENLEPLGNWRNAFFFLPLQTPLRTKAACSTQGKTVHPCVECTRGEAMENPLGKKGSRFLSSLLASKVLELEMERSVRREEKRAKWIPLGPRKKKQLCRGSRTQLIRDVAGRTLLTRNLEGGKISLVFLGQTTFGFKS